MDKFGFFKLLNSFLPSIEPKSDADKVKNDGNGDVKNDALSSFINSLSEQNFNKNNQSSEQQKSQKEPAPQKPLQASMLNVMNSHDDFIKRVKSRNNQTNR